VTGRTFYKMLHYVQRSHDNELAEQMVSRRRSYVQARWKVAKLTRDVQALAEQRDALSARVAELEAALRLATREANREAMQGDYTRPEPYTIDGFVTAVGDGQ